MGKKDRQCFTIQLRQLRPYMMILDGVAKQMEVSIEILPPENALQASTNQLLYAACCVYSALHWDQEH